ncbi:MAG: hypothetical protein IKF53_04985 [Clostridia bacterium]|nr:hypothetical protein [Clostridia bacterium]
MKNQTKKINFSKIFSNKSVAIPFSLIISLIVWMVIVIDQNPVREQVFTNVTPAISLENTAANERGLGIVSDLSKEKFTVTVKGPNYIVSSLRTDDFTLTADISDINTAGTYNLEIVGNYNSTKSGYSFVSISPSSIDVTFDYIDTKEFTIEPKLIGVSAAEGLVAETPVPANSDQNTITIKGPRSIMQKIASVGSVAEVNKVLSTTQTFDSYVVLYDENNELLYRYTLDGKVFNSNDEEVTDRRLTLTYTTLKVTQPISKKKTLNVTPSFKNIPEGIDTSVFSPEVDRTSVTVIGTPEVIDKMTTLTLSQIDFQSISISNNSFEIAPNLPDGVKLDETIDYFTVTLDMNGFSEKTLNVSDIRFNELSKNLKVSAYDYINNIKICGPTSVINNLSASDLYADVNLTGKAAGNYTLDATIESDKYNNIWVYGKYTVTVTLK